MRISDWSSDVCSSDLLVDADCAADDGEVLAAPAVDDALELRCAQMGQLREQQLEERQIAPAQGLHDGIGGGFRLATVLGAWLGLGLGRGRPGDTARGIADRKSTRLNSSTSWPV